MEAPVKLLKSISSSTIQRTPRPLSIPLRTLLPDYNIYSVAELVSLTNVDNVPFLRPLLNVIIGVAVLIGAAVASLSMYMAVQQRTREIGILKSLGASKLLVVRIILMEAFCLGLGGAYWG